MIMKSPSYYLINSFYRKIGKPVNILSLLLPKKEYTKKKEHHCKYNTFFDSLEIKKLFTCYYLNSKK